jgi:hypothetical protein
VSTLDTSTDGFEALWNFLSSCGRRHDSSPLLRAYTNEHYEHVPLPSTLTPADTLGPEESHNLLSLMATHAHRPMPDSLKGKKGYLRNRGIWSGGSVDHKMQGPDVPTWSELDYQHTQDHTAPQLLGLPGGPGCPGWVNTVFVYTAIYLYAHRFYTANPGRGRIDVIHPDNSVPGVRTRGVMDNRTTGFFWQDRLNRTGGLASQSLLTFHRTSGTRPRLTIIPRTNGSQHWELVSILHPLQYVEDQSEPPILHYHIYDSLYSANNTTATDRPPPLTWDVSDLIRRAYGYPASTVFSAGTQFPVTSARQVGLMDCGVFVVRAAMHLISGTPFTEPAARQTGSEAQLDTETEAEAEAEAEARAEAEAKLDLHYGWLLMAWRAELFLSMLLFSPPLDGTDGSP